MSNRKMVMLTKDYRLSSHLADYVLSIGQFLLDLASLKTVLACSILWGCERQLAHSVIIPTVVLLFTADSFMKD